MKPVRALSDELQSKAVEELNEDPSRGEEDLHHIRQWLKKQPHLNARQDDQFLISFARGCKWSLQRIKEKLDLFYTMRSSIPEFFTNRDPFLPEIQKVLKSGAFYPLPKTTNSTEPTVLFYNFANIDSEETPFVCMVKVFFMTLDVLMLEDDNLMVSGLVIIADYTNFPLSYVAQLTPVLVKKYVNTLQNAYPLRFKFYAGLNVPQFFEVFYNTVWKPLLNEKLKTRVLLFGKASDKINERIDKSILPIDLGGKNASVLELANQWKSKLESYREWFIDDAKYKSDEQMRLGKTHMFANEYGTDGSFRKLTLD